MAASGLAAAVASTAARHPDRPALEVGTATYTYRALMEAARRLAAALDAADPAPRKRLTAVLGHRSMGAFSGVLAALVRGHGYVPLHPGYPGERIADMFRRSGAGALVVDRTAVNGLEAVLDAATEPVTVALPGDEVPRDWAARWPAHRFVGRAQIAAAPPRDPEPVRSDDIAYVLFTSGSTGHPKGVAVSQGNVLHFIHSICQRYALCDADRLSQMFDLTFDLSAFDMFAAWLSGACLCCPDEGQKLLPAGYIKSAGLTVWFSVPSAAVVMSRLRLLTNDRFPGLRVSLFCGEALPADITAAWQRAAPASVVDNLYGPTELTIACTAYRWDPARSPGECQRNVVPIGWPLPGMEALIVDEELNEVAPGDDGELIMTGPQLSLGYLDDPAKTARAFVRPPGRDHVFYRTGDRVRRPARAEDPIQFLGRADNQVKVRGFRIELGEVEAVIRSCPAVDGAVVVAWPRTTAGADGLVAFVTGAGVDVGSIEGALRERLPPYMHPREVRVLAQLPLNSNGKVDRRSLESSLSPASPG